ncbi:LutC/YkgG family protein [Tanticharoenia sakaeratensis]|uniref:LutC/YkgG family protein n=2 Tax=Tanticharoenia sakaeratensis TaxID=444053 RepID=UPI0021567F62|nr:lactate utilization protein [Tanticharoenia sakaeratensis]GBQ23112.1 hypothetical protein AA103193_2298 [Tanticharoenia sakaeratensis NBRC 103193]
MSARDQIFSAIRANRLEGDFPRPPVPLFDDAAPADLQESFLAALKAMGGTILTPDATDPMAPVRKMMVHPGPVLSCVPDIDGDFVLTPDTKPADLGDVQYGIVRAAFAVAETGSLCFTEAELRINTSGFLPQHLVVLLDPADIVYNLHNAYRRAEWRNARYAVFQSGPSATADIEGVLVHGAQGVRSLNMLMHKK